MSKLKLNHLGLYLFWSAELTQFPQIVVTFDCTRFLIFNQDLLTKMEWNEKHRGDEVTYGQADDEHAGQRPKRGHSSDREHDQDIPGNPQPGYDAVDRSQPHLVLEGPNY